MVAGATTMGPASFFFFLIPSIFSWARYPCGGTFTGFYQADTGFSMTDAGRPPANPTECYWNIFDIVTPTTKGTTHQTRAFVQDSFDLGPAHPEMDPWPRVVEVIVEPQQACFRCPEFTISCADEYAFDQCWSQHKWMPDGPLSTTLKPIDEGQYFTVA